MAADGPGYFSHPRRLAKWNRHQLACWVREVWSGRGYPRQAVARESTARVIGMLLAFRHGSTKLASVAHALGKLVGPKVTQGLVEARRVCAAKERERSERNQREQFPYPLNADGTRDIARSASYQRQLDDDADDEEDDSP